MPDIVFKVKADDCDDGYIRARVFAGRVGTTLALAGSLVLHPPEWEVFRDRLLSRPTMTEYATFDVEESWKE